MQGRPSRLRPLVLLRWQEPDPQLPPSSGRRASKRRKPTSFGLISSPVATSLRLALVFGHCNSKIKLNRCLYRCTGNQCTQSSIDFSTLTYQNLLKISQGQFGRIGDSSNTQRGFSGTYANIYFSSSRNKTSMQ